MLQSRKRNARPTAFELTDGREKYGLRRFGRDLEQPTAGARRRVEVTGVDGAKRPSPPAVETGAFGRIRRRYFGTSFGDGTPGSSFLPGAAAIR